MKHYMFIKDVASTTSGKHMVCVQTITAFSVDTQQPSLYGDRFFALCKYRPAPIGTQFILDIEKSNQEFYFIKK